MYIEFDENQPVYTQIIDGFKRQIFGGYLDAGQRIPPVRELAAQLEVNPNTLQKALLELERCGLVKARRTAGRYVTLDEQEIIRQRQAMMQDIIARFLAQMDELGCSYAEIMAVVDSHYGVPAPAPSVDDAIYAEPAYPEEVAYPEETVYPEAAAYPEEAAYPEGATYPEEAAYTEEVTYTEEAVYPPEAGEYIEAAYDLPPQESAASEAKADYAAPSHAPPTTPVPPYGEAAYIARLAQAYADAEADGQDPEDPA